MKNITIRTTHALSAADLSALYQYTNCVQMLMYWCGGERTLWDIAALDLLRNDGDVVYGVV